MKKFFLILILIISVVIFWSFRSRFNSQKEESSLSLKEKAASVTAEMEIGRSFDLNAKDLNNKDAKVGFTLVEVKKVKQVSTQNKPLESLPGEEFLVLSLEFANDKNFSLKANSQDLIRLVKEENKRYAPDFFNGWIEIPAFSVKKDELAFVVSEDQKEFKLQVGNIEGEKTEIEIKF